MQTEIKCVQCAGKLRKETFHGFLTQVIKRARGFGPHDGSCHLSVLPMEDGILHKALGAVVQRLLPR